MPKTLKTYKNQNKARDYRNRHRKRNYDQTVNAENSHKIWDSTDEKLLFDFDGTDRELSTILKRGMRAIQVKRSKLISSFNNSGDADGPASMQEGMRMGAS